MSNSDACEPGTVTPLCTPVLWWPPDPEIGNPWFPVPGYVWVDPNSEANSDYDGSYWPPHTPGTCCPSDLEDDW